MEGATTVATLGYTQYQHMHSAIRDDAQGLEQAARQFESMFINMWLKSARDANASLVSDGPFSSPELKMHQEMLDGEMSIHLAQSGGVGLADVIVKQLQQARDLRPSVQRDAAIPLISAVPSPRSSHTAEPARTTASAPERVGERARLAYASVRPTGDAGNEPRNSMFASAKDFVQNILPLVERTASAAGFPVVGLVSQAALETGWGAHIMASAKGRSTFNLFGIKADPAAADVSSMVEVTSREFELGRWTARPSHFRIYENFTQSVEDYVSLIRSSPRYSEVMRVRDDPAAYFKALQEAGYATDPRYAEKVLSVAQRVKELAGL